jgi:tetratricopeptide (TPR) repeat protein
MINTALATLEIALAHSPNDGDLHLRLGQTLIGQNRLDEAKPHLEQSRTLLPKSPKPLAFLATIAIQRNNKSEALKLLNQALKLDPQNYVIRKQRWQLEFPEKFHPSIDWGWQREQMKKELEEEKCNRDGS